MPRVPVYVGEPVLLARSRSVCPTCSAVLGAASGLTPGKRPAETPMPEPGDVTICSKCGEALEVQPDHSLAKASSERMARMSSRVRRLAADVQRAARERNAK